MSEEKNMPNEAEAPEVGKVTDAVRDASETAGKVTDAVKEAAPEAAEAVGSAGGGVREAAAKVEETAGAAVDGIEQVAAEPAEKKRKKWPITLGVIVAIVALAGIGMWIWHEQPSFCNSFCHTSMDAYLASYDQEDNVAGTDKYGNEVTNTHAMLAVSHKSMDMACLDCHIPAIDQQIGEVIETITGNYEVLERRDGNGFALHEVALKDLQENAHLANDSGIGDEFCLRSGCHDFTREQLVAATDSMEFNPHRAQHGEIACGECHKSHRASVHYCSQCHNEAAQNLPEGWVTAEEGKAMIP